MTNLTTDRQTKNQSDNGPAQGALRMAAGDSSIYANLLALFTLTAVQLLTFLPIISRIGYYLDDWATLAYLHFAPKSNLLEFLYSYFINDGRVLIRPVEVLHYGLIYWFFSDGSYSFHLINLGFEIAAAFLCYLILKRISGIPSLSLAASFFFLLHPGHDASRYWVIAASLGLSMLFYLGSLWSALKFHDAPAKSAKRWGWLFVSFLSFAAGMFNYESILPLCAITVMIVFALKMKELPADASSKIKQSALATIPHIVAAVAAIGSLLFFLKVGVPMLGQGYDHAATVDLGLMMQTLYKGVDINLTLTPVLFYWSQAQASLADFSSSEKTRLIVSTLIMLISALALRLRELKTDSARYSKPYLSPACLAFIGVISVIAAYSIFGISRDYQPTMVTIVNRINVGADFAVSILFLSLLYLLELILNKALKAVSEPKRVYAAVGVSTLCSTFVLSVLLLANWGMAKPWLVSWQTQSHIRGILEKLKTSGQLPKNASVLLVNCPRYAMWAPVFDGVWDFQNLVRIINDNNKASANVVSDRMTITREGISDVSYGYECGKYSFKDLYLLVAPSGDLVRVDNAQTFIDVVDKRGRQFGLDDNVFKRWREQAAGNL